MRNILAAILAVLPAMALSTGCVSTIAKQAYYGATGASGRYFELKAVQGPTAMDKFKAVQVKTFKADSLLGTMPAEVITLTAEQIVEYLRKPEKDMLLFDEVGRGAPSLRPALVIEGEFIDYDPGGSPARVVGLGGNPFVTARIRLLDGGRVIGIAHVTGTVKSAVRVGDKELASGLAKAVRGLIKAHHSEPPKDNGG